MFELLAQEAWTVPRAPWWIPLLAPGAFLVLASSIVVARSPARRRRASRRREALHEAAASTVQRDHAAELAELRARQDAETLGLFSDTSLLG